MSIRIVTDSNCDLPQAMIDEYRIMERVRTRKVALTRVIELLSRLGALEELAVVHTHAPEEAAALGREARDLPPQAVISLSAEATPVIGTHIGPGAMGFVAIQARSQ